MSRIKPLTAVNCHVTYGDEHAMEGGTIYACTRCRGIGFFDMRGTMIRGQDWINGRDARKTYEAQPGTIRTPEFLHHCMRDTKHPINKRVSQKQVKRRGF